MCMVSWQTTTSGMCVVRHLQVIRVVQSEQVMLVMSTWLAMHKGRVDDQVRLVRQQLLQGLPCRLLNAWMRFMQQRHQLRHQRRPGLGWQAIQAFAEGLQACLWVRPAARQL